jgi:hypothetical protein
MLEMGSFTSLLADSLHVRYSPDSDLRADIAGRRRGAMCGRLRVGKGYLHVRSIGRCSHVFGLFARFT